MEPIQRPFLALQNNVSESYLSFESSTGMHTSEPMKSLSQPVMTMEHSYIDRHQASPAYATTMPQYTMEHGIMDGMAFNQLNSLHYQNISLSSIPGMDNMTMTNEFLLTVQKEFLPNMPKFSSSLNSVPNSISSVYSLLQYPTIFDKHTLTISLNLAYEKYNHGLYEEAYSLCFRIYEVMPNYLQNLLLLGCVCFRKELYDEALQYNNKIIELDPNFAEAYSNMGAVQRMLGNYELAMSFYRHAIHLKPYFWDAYDNMASLCLHQSGKYVNGIRGSTEEMINYKNELKIFSYQTLAKLFQNEDNIEGAIHTYLAALRFHPNPNCCNNLGILLSQTGKLDEAISYYCHGLEIEPKHVHLLTNLGSAYKEKGLLNEAVQYYLTALQLDSRFHIALINLANLYKDVGRIDQAIQYYEQALEITPGAPDAFCNYIHAKLSICDWSNRDSHLRKMEIIVLKQLEHQELPSVLPFHCFIYPIDEKHIKSISIKHAEKALKNISIRFSHHRRHKHPEERLRIGYVSSDFGNHPLSHLMQSVFGMHYRSKFEIFCYATSVDDGSTYREKIKTESEHFIDLTSMSNEEASKQIYHDRIHILVNLNGYTKGARNEIFAAQPAPIQVSSMGFPGTMGASYIHYLITDTIATPPETSHLYTEHLVYMPDSYFVTDHRQSFRGIFEKDKLPSRFDLFPHLLPNTIIFANFNQMYKIDPFIFDTWIIILKSVPNSVLWLLRFPSPAEPYLLHEAEIRGISRNRILFTDVSFKQEYILKNTIADIFLDTPECNGHTTAADVLWAGVPIITYPKVKMASRVCASLCNATGLGKYMIAHSYLDYQNKAIRLAMDSQLRNHLRHELEVSRDTNFLFNTQKWIRNVEIAYLKIWDNYEKGILSPLYVSGRHEK
jgi:protein O-GlcNAc transferase